MIHLKRITTGKRFIPQIDGLRFVAILSVVLFHINGHFTFGQGAVRPLMTDGALLDMLAKRGVELFFVISGFILATPFASNRLLGAARVNIKNYYLRRVTRLEPPYILNLLIWFAILVVAFHQSAAALLPHLAASILYIHQIVYAAPSTISGIMWSLEVEIQFYILAPVLASVFLIRNPVWRRSLLIAAILLSGVLSIPLAYTPAQLSILYYLNFFLAGILLCDLYITRDISWEHPNGAWDLISLGGWPLVWIPLRSTSHVFAPLLIALLYVAAFRGRLSTRLFSNPVLTTVGGMCYSIYLYHWLVMSSAAKLTSRFHIGGSFVAYFLLQCVLLLPCVLLVSTIFYVLIERPCMDKDWPRKLRTWVVSEQRPWATFTAG